MSTVLLISTYTLLMYPPYSLGGGGSVWNLKWNGRIFRTSEYTVYSKNLNNQFFKRLNIILLIATRFKKMKYSKNSSLHKD